MVNPDGKTHGVSVACGGTILSNAGRVRPDVGVGKGVFELAGAEANGTAGKVGAAAALSLLWQFANSRKSRIAMDEYQRQRVLMTIPFMKLGNKHPRAVEKEN